MKIFWPYRSSVKGFSIKNFAGKYHEKSSSASFNNISNQFSGDRKLKSKKKDSNHISTYHLNTKRKHWANRDFSEYKEVA
tara:strand:- start:371 stop:610 length:240 start_codon:yes stop_codon:yes gene_type:complete